MHSGLFFFFFFAITFTVNFSFFFFFFFLSDFFFFLPSKSLVHVLGPKSFWEEKKKRVMDPTPVLRHLLG